MSGAPVTVFAPATVGNVACGFDVFGLAVERPGDEVTATPVPEPGVRIGSITGDGGRLPTDPGRNAASAAARAVLEQADSGQGLVLDIRKGLPLAGGLGGSAASAVAGAVAADAAVGAGLPREVLLRCAVRGEAAGSGAAHADNAAPCLYGGIVLVLPGGALHVVELPVPDELYVVLVHPHVEVETEAARSLLGDTIALSRGITQWANTAGFVAGLFREDWGLIARSVVDVVAEPHRAPMVPGFPQVKADAIRAGALACSLSGSGPSTFALCRGPISAERVADAMRDAFLSAALESEVYLSRVDRRGARVVPSGGLARTGAP